MAKIIVQSLAGWIWDVARNATRGAPRRELLSAPSDNMGNRHVDPGAAFVREQLRPHGA